MELDILKLHTTWNDAAGSINTNFSKIKMAIASLQEGSGGLNEEELLSFLVNNGYITEEDLSDYYTKYEVNELIDRITAGDIDLANYYTKEQIDDMGFLTSASLAGYATQGYVSEQISKIDLSSYAKTADIANAYATKLSLAVEAQRIDTLESYFSTSADADAQINKWNEIVSFLNATEGTTLAGILAAYTLKEEFTEEVSRINTEVDSKASKASTLAGYGITDAYTKTEIDGEIAGINSAIAKKADADNVYTITQIDTKVLTINNALADRYTKGDIDGKITTINGVLTSHDNRIKSLEDMWYLENGVVKSKYPMMSKGYAAGVTATADGGGGGIINKESIISALQYTPVNPADLGALAYRNGLSYSDVGVNKEVVTSLIGSVTYAPYNASGYLPLSGGNLTGKVTTTARIRLKGTILEMPQGDGTGGIMLWNGESSGDGVRNLIIYDGTSWKQAIHSGNIGSNKAGDSAKLNGYTLSAFARCNYVHTKDDDVAAALAPGMHRWESTASNMPSVGYQYGNSLVVRGDSGAADTAWILYSGYGNDYLYFRSGTTSNIGSKTWKTIAFTDSDITGNAATATKLATARTIWGQSFDGTGNVNGDLRLEGELKFAGVYSIQSYNNSPLSINAQGNNILLSPNGYSKVGVRTDNPQYSLDVNGTIGVYESLNFTRQSWNYITVPTTSGVLSFNVGAAGTANTKMCILNNGNVLIGSTTDVGTGAKLQVNGGISIASGYTLKIGDATISYVNGVLKVDKPFMSKGYAAGATASVSSGEGGVVLNKDSIIEALGYTPYDSANPNGYITTSALSGYQLSSGLGSLAYKSSLVASDIPDLSSKYLPISGGTISGVFGALTIKRHSEHASGIKYENTNGVLGYLGFNGFEPYFWGENMSNAKALLHSGNIGDYALKINGSNKMAAGIKWEDAMLTANNSVQNSGLRLYYLTDEPISPTSTPYITTLSAISSYAGFQIGVHGGSILAPYFRKINAEGTWSDWKTIAFVDSNVASAYRLLTKNNKYMVYLSDAGNLIVGDNIATGETHIIGNRVILRYGTSAAYGLILNSSGNVTIGAGDLAATIPACKFYVDGKIVGKDEINLFQSKSNTRLTHYVTNGVGRIYTYDENNGYCDTHIGRSDGSAIVAKGNGNVLIGTTTDSGYKLEVKGKLGVTDTNAAIEIVNGGVAGNVAMSMSVSTYARIQATHHKTDYNVPLAINPDGGNVGIGTTSPAYKLDVSDTARFQGSVFADRYNTKGAGASVVINKGADFFGIGPSAHEISSLSLGITADQAGTWVSEFMTFTYDGKVGIGITNPQAKLDVAGTARISGAVTMNSTLNVATSATSPKYITKSEFGLYIGSLFTNALSDSDIALYGGVIAMAGVTRPHRHNYYTLGESSYRWSTIYGNNGDFSGALTAAGATINGTLNVSSGNVIKIGDATISYENGVLKIDKPLMAKGYAAGATATAN